MRNIIIKILAFIILGIITAGCSSPAQQQAAATPKPTQATLYYFGNGTFNVKTARSSR